MEKDPITEAFKSEEPKEQFDPALILAIVGAVGEQIAKVAESYGKAKSEKDKQDALNEAERLRLVEKQMELERESRQMQWQENRHIREFLSKYDTRNKCFSVILLIVVFLFLLALYALGIADKEIILVFVSIVTVVVGFGNRDIVPIWMGTTTKPDKVENNTTK